MVYVFIADPLGLRSILRYLVAGALVASFLLIFFFFFQAEDGIRDWSVTGVQTCALPIYDRRQPELRVVERAADRQVQVDDSVAVSQQRHRQAHGQRGGRAFDGFAES